MRDELGIEDAWPVVAEPFFQWVLEDDHPAGRPRYEDADVQLVEDVEPYELMKLRLLNASHQGMCYFGYLSGYRYAHEATQDEAIATFLRRYMDEEASPTLHPVPGIDLADYQATLIERFRNPEVRDTSSPACAPSRAIASRSGCCPSSARTSRPAVRSRCRPASSRRGRGTPRAPTRGSRSRSSTASPTG